MNEFLKVKDGKAVVAVKGSLKVSVVARLKEDLNEELEKGCKEVLFDFKDTTFIDSTGLGLVVGIYRKLGKGKVRAINQTGEVLRVFGSARLVEELK